MHVPALSVHEHAQNEILQMGCHVTIEAETTAQPRVGTRVGDPITRPVDALVITADDGRVLAGVKVAGVAMPEGGRVDGVVGRDPDPNCTFQTSISPSSVAACIMPVSGWMAMHMTSARHETVDNRSQESEPHTITW
mmetsp:Transcript_17274/g.37301  ORF Transcript_17274/g.37301 Transcript_17274/m.37301 type:complete len:137 (-) Transcript_17274:930-1340(-)